MKLLSLALAAFTATMLVSCATSKIPKERHVTVQTKAKFKQQSIGGAHSYYTLEIKSDGDDRSIYWPTNAPKPLSLNKNRSYTVELLEEEHRMPIGDDGFNFWSPELFRLIDGDRLLYDASMCRVHGIKMNRVVVPIAYGLYMPDQNYSRAEDSAFPNAGVVLGGCCVDTERPSTHTWVCPTCLANKSRWEEQRKGQKTNG